MPVSKSMVTRRQLGRRLKHLRLSAGLPVDAAVEAGIGSDTKIWRIETGKVPVSIPTIRAFAQLYGCTPDETEALVQMFRDSNEQGWWERNSDAPSWFRQYVGLENAASEIFTFDGEVVPGVLQTEAYTWAIFRASRPDLPDTGHKPHIELRLERQRALFGRTPPVRKKIVLGEGVLRRQVGGPDVLAEQIAHLRELDQRDDVDIRVLTFAAGAHPAALGAFRLLDFPDPEDPPVVYIENQVSALYLEKPDEVSEYRRMRDLLIPQSTPFGDFYEKSYT